MIKFETFLKDKSGLRVIPDVHGHFHEYETLIGDALSKNYGIIQLGDLVDRGPDCPSVVETTINLNIAGKLWFVPGNHDDKIRRFFKTGKVKIEGDLKVTFDQFEAQGKMELLKNFAVFVAESPLYAKYRNFVFAHAAWHPQMMEEEPKPVSAYTSKDGSLKAAALFGYSTGEEDDNGYPVRDFSFLEKLPPGLIVMLGHTIRSNIYPLTIKTANEASVTWLDTGIGASKLHEKGPLSCIDIPIRDILDDKT